MQGKERGFTLAEVMSTLAIAAITTTLAVPMMSNLINTNGRSVMTNELVATMHSARSQAITRNQQVTICASNNATDCNDAEWHEGLIWFVDTDRNRQIGGNEKLLGSLAAFEHTVIRSQEFDRFLVFRPNGKIMINSTAENSGEMLICDLRESEFSRILVLSAAGKPQLFESDDPEVFRDCESS